MPNYTNPKKAQCIYCSVEQCQHHSASDNCCTLDSIRVATHEANPTECKCTDCENFICKN